LAFANILIFAPPGTQANRRAAVAQRRYATASRRFRSDCLRPLPPLRTLPPEWERRAGSSHRSRQNAPLGRKRHLPRILWLPTPRLLADIESLTSSFCRRRRCRISRQQSTWLSYRAGRLLAIRKKRASRRRRPWLAVDHRLACGIAAEGRFVRYWLRAAAPAETALTASKDTHDICEKSSARNAKVRSQAKAATR
jgi:hypothetical protein